ncbi:MAG: amidohydrolase family protein [Acidimicrobiales bacterium]|jgi:predicted TIM-barrel fold metal-dependent hydrolase|nr:amidohydrolase family protein [Acidimicrobiales bacterium]
MNPDDLILISVDDHICEPADMFEGRVPKKYEEFTPKVVETETSQQWWYGDVRGRDLGINAVAGKPREMYNISASRYDEMRRGCWDVDERVRDMDAGGVLGSLNFPNFTGFSGQVLNQGPDPNVNEAMIRAYNDWHVDAWCGSHPDRFVPCGILPLFDVERAAAEVRRLADKDCHAVTFSENPEALKMPSIHSGEWDPLFAACCDTGTVLCAHLGSSSRTTMTSRDAPMSVPVALSPAMTIFTLADLVWNDIWWRFPDLKFSLTEGDIGWIPFFLQRAEHVQNVQSGWTGHTFPDGTGPMDVFRKHVLVCFISDPVGLELIDHFNIDHVHWECDYPHSDSTWPNSPERVAAEFGELTDEQVAKITHENAMRNFGFDPFAHRAKEDCTVGALRATATDVDLVTHVGRKSTGDLTDMVAMAKAAKKPT